MKKRIFSLFLALCMVLSMMPTVFAAEGDSEPTTIDLSQDAYTIETAGSYVVSAYTGANTLTIKADATITLSGVNITAAADTSAISIESGNVTLNVAADSILTGGDNGAGIYVAEDASVTIQGTGKLTAIGNAGADDASGAAGIGGTWANGNSGAITIDGATVIAKGYGVHGSGIGSGSGKVVGEIKIINHANVTAQGGYYSEGGKLLEGDKYGDSLPEGGAAIGGGGKTASTVAAITIADSEVTAYGGSKAAGIGANFWCSVKLIDIDNSTVTAYGGVSSAGIGTSRAGDNGVSADIKITDSTVNATGGYHGAGIGGGYNADSVATLPTITIVIDGASDVTAAGQNGGAGIGGGYKTNNIVISITGTAKVTAKASQLNDGSDKTIDQTTACAIGSGANGSGTFEGSKVTIADTATVDVTNNYEADGGKPAVEGYTYKDGTLTKPWYDPDATEYHITCEADLWAFAEAAKEIAAASGEPFKGKTVYLDADIDLNWAEWYPINFYGTFEGGNHTIKNLTYIPRDDGRMGFFQHFAGGAVAKNLTLDGIKGTVPANGRFGGFARNMAGTGENIHIKNVEVTTTDTLAWVGGFTAYMNWGWTHDCSVENFTVNAAAGADLIAGFAALLQKNSNMVYDNCDVKNFKVTVTDTDSSGCGVGGFMGQDQRGWEFPKITNSDITGIDISATGLVDVGGFVAWPGAHTTCVNCTTEGKIDVTGVTSDGCFAGGFFGNAGWNDDLGQMGHVLTNCSADVDIVTKVADAGGFIGQSDNSNAGGTMYITYNNCSASGDITCVEGGTADIGGFFGSGDRGVYNSCSASGTVINNGTGWAGEFGGALVLANIKDSDYDYRYPAGTREYGVDEITISACAYSGASTELNFIGNIAEGVDVDILDPVAQIGSTLYTSLQEALNDATNGETVKLIADITYDADDITYASIGVTGYENYAQYNPSIIVIGGTKGATAAENQPSSVNAVLNLNGHTITNNAEAYLFFVGDNAKLTIKDSGNGDGVIGNTEWPVVWSMGTETLVTIESGKYTTVNDEGLMWATHSGDLVIKGGELKTTADDASLLIVRNSRMFNNPNYFLSGQATITVTGGTFYGFNPEKMFDDVTTDPFTEFNAVADLYTAFDNGDGSWTVAYDYVKEIKADLLAGKDVTLKQDIVVDGYYIDSISNAVNGNGQYPNYGIFNVYGNTVTFDLNGHTITYNGHADFACGENDKFTGNSCTVAHGLFMANSGANLTIKDSVGTSAVTVYGLASGVYSCSPNSIATIEGGTWTNEGCANCGGTNLFLYASHGGELYIKDGYFEQALDSEGKSYLIVAHGGSASNAVVDFSKTKIEITGGTFVGLDPENAVYCEQAGWGTQKWGTTNVVADGYKSLKVTDNTWIVGIPSVVTIDYKNGQEKKVIETVTGAEITLDTPERFGYEFKGWSDGKNVYVGGDTYTVVGTVTLTAQWKKIYYASASSTTVTFVAGDEYALAAQKGTSTKTDGSVVVTLSGSKLAETKIPDVIPADAYYEFVDWAVEDKDGDLVAIDLTTYKFTKNTKVYVIMEDVWTPYTDMKQDRSDWYYQYVRDLSIAGVVNGVPGGAFAPADEVTWGVALKLIMLAVGYEEQAPVNAHWASGYLAAALRDGLVTAEQNIDLDATLTRLEYAQVAYKAMGLKKVNIATPFADTDDAAVLALYKAGIFEGTINAAGVRLYNPDNNITRSEISTVIWRINNYED